MKRAVGERAILEMIRSKMATSQIEISRVLGLPANTVHGMVKRLEADGLIVEERQERGPRGRPSVHYAIRMPGKVLAIKCYGTETWGLVLGEGVQGDSEVVRFNSAPVTSVGEAYPLLTKIRDQALEEAGVKLKQLDGAVVLFNRSAGTDGAPLFSSVMPWVGEVTNESLTRTLGCKAVMSEVLNTADLELRSWTREGVQSLVFFNVGDGVSAHFAMLAGPWAHIESLPGEVGHVVRKEGGEICGCGNRGCLETLISGPRMLRRAKHDFACGVHTHLEQSLKKTPAEFLLDLDAADQAGGDPYAHTLVEEFLEHCAWGISVAVNVFQPELVVLSGYALQGREHWKSRIAATLRSRILGSTGNLRLEFSCQKPGELMREIGMEYFLAEKGI